jgi:hypothetical protein
LPGGDTKYARNLRQKVKLLRQPEGPKLREKVALIQLLFKFERSLLNFIVPNCLVLAPSF